VYLLSYTHTCRSPPCTAYSITPTGLCIYLLLSFRHTCTSTTCLCTLSLPVSCVFNFYCLAQIRAGPTIHCVLYHSHWTVHLSSIVFQAYMHVHDVPVYPITPTELCIYCLLSWTHTCRSPPCTAYSITPTGLCIYLLLSVRHTYTSTTCQCTLSIPLSFVFIFYCLARIHAGPHHALHPLSLPLDCAFIFYCISSIHERPRRACVPYHSH